MKGRRFFTWILILSSSLLSIRCATVDVRKEQACPMFGDLHLDFTGKKSLTVEGYSGIVTVPADQTTKAKAIDNKEALNTFLASYKSICGQEPPFYNDIAYVRRMKIGEEAKKTETEIKKEEELLAETEKKKQEALARQKGRKQTGFNLDALEATIDSGILLEKEGAELEKAGQTIKAKRKQSEAEQKWKEIIEKKFRVGQSISATAECPFQRLPIQMSGEGYATRIFRLSCFDKRLIKEQNQQDQANENIYLDIIFEFKVPVDSSNNWPAWAQTSNDIAEKFESSSDFIGSTQIVGNWETTSFNLFKKEVKRKVEAVEIEDNSYSSNRILMKVKVKIVRLQPVN